MWRIVCGERASPLSRHSRRASCGRSRWPSSPPPPPRRPRSGLRSGWESGGDGEIDPPAPLLHPLGSARPTCGQRSARCASYGRSPLLPVREVRLNQSHPCRLWVHGIRFPPRQDPLPAPPFLVAKPFRRCRLPSTTPYQSPCLVTISWRTKTLHLTRVAFYAIVSLVSATGGCDLRNGRRENTSKRP